MTHLTVGGLGLDPGPPTRQERQFTRRAPLGWLSWDAWSPERDFCAFVGMLQRMLSPALVLETGVGVGRLTSFLDLGSCKYLGFESDPAWRQPPAVDGRETPTESELAQADLVLLDSDPAYRLGEIAGWAQHGKPGSVCVVHDCGAPNDRRLTHRRIREVVEATGVPGILLRNPRGGWLGWHP